MKAKAHHKNKRKADQKIVDYVRRTSAQEQQYDPMPGEQDHDLLPMSIHSPAARLFSDFGRPVR
jgi:hypothetical protein